MREPRSNSSHASDAVVDLAWFAAVKEAGGQVFVLEAPRGEPTWPPEVGFMRLRESAEEALRQDPKHKPSKFDGDAASRCGYTDALRLAVGYGLPRHDDPTTTRFTPKVRCTAAASLRSHWHADLSPPASRARASV